MPGYLEDVKEQKKLKQALDKGLYDMDQADRLEQQGYDKEAKAAKEKISDRLMGFKDSMIKAQLARETEELQNQARVQAASALAGNQIGLQQLEGTQKLAQIETASEVAAEKPPTGTAVLGYNQERIKYLQGLSRKISPEEYTELESILANPAVFSPYSKKPAKTATPEEKSMWSRFTGLFTPTEAATSLPEQAPSPVTKKIKFDRYGNQI